MPWVIASSDLLHSTASKDHDHYISVVHREMLPLVATALGLYNNSMSNTFPLDQINYQHVWKSSQFVPFLGQIVLERLQCTSISHTGKFVRVLVKTVPRTLPGCKNGPARSCSLTDFTDYVNERGDSFEKFSKACKMNDRTTTNVLTFF